ADLPRAAYRCCQLRQGGVPGARSPEMRTTMTSATPTLPQILPPVRARTGIKTSRLALGQFGWGKTGPAIARVENERALVAVLKTAFEAGIRYLDTAEQYQNEDDLGRLLPEANPPADLIVATKFGRGEFTADAFRA